MLSQNVDCGHNWLKNLLTHYCACEDFDRTCQQ